MYEKPQYFTSDGLIRLPRNPFREEQSLAQKIAAQSKEKKLAKPEAKTASTAAPRSLRQFILQQRGIKSKPQKGISEEAAKLIALALKDMLRS